MEKGTEKLTKKLLSRLYTTAELKKASVALESLTQNQAFKKHAQSIVVDHTLSPSQKQTQLLYLIRGVDNPTIYDFFKDELTTELIWLFNTEKIDYFDRFVATFQEMTENLKVVSLVTAIPLPDQDMLVINEQLAKFFGFAVIIDHEVNPNIIGGLQARLDNVVFDVSLRSKFRSFEKNWLSSLQDISQTIE